MISKFVKTRNAYVNALESINDDRAFHIGRYTGILQKQNESLRQENETLSAANNDLKKEILILKNKLEVRHELQTSKKTVPACARQPKDDKDKQT